MAQSSDNDGFFNGLYLGAMSLAYEVTRKPVYKERAKRTFRALSFLSEVTQGGSNPGAFGLIARTVLPTEGPNPNLKDRISVELPSWITAKDVYSITPNGIEDLPFEVTKGKAIIRPGDIEVCQLVAVVPEGKSKQQHQQEYENARADETRKFD